MTFLQSRQFGNHRWVAFRMFAFLPAELIGPRLLPALVWRAELQRDFCWRAEGRRRLWMPMSRNGKRTRSQDIIIYPRL